MCTLKLFICIIHVHSEIIYLHNSANAKETDMMQTVNLIGSYEAPNKKNYFSRILNHQLLQQLVFFTFDLRASRL